jgi:predicted metalloprotease with PDZ domain
VLSALDQRIRNETNGQRSLDDVVYRMNTHNGTVTYADFKQIVQTVAGTSFDAWLDARVTTSMDPDPGLRKNACRWHLTIQQLLHTNKGRAVLAMAALVVIATGYRIYQWQQD